MGDPDAARSRWQERFDQAAKRDADFTTLSGLEVGPVYGPPPGAVVPGLERIGWPGEFPFTRGIHATGYRGKPWTIRQFSGFGNARQTNERYKMLLRAGRRRALGGLRHADADGPRLRRPALAGRSGALRGGDRLGRRHGRAVRGHPAGRHHHLDDDQRAGRPRLLHVPGRGRTPGRGPAAPGRDPADRHLQGVHRAEGVAVPAAPAPAPHRRPDAVLRREHPPVQAAVGVRLPHQGGGLDRRAGARLHPRRRVRVRGTRPVPRPGYRAVRAGPVVLLRRAHRLLRGDREVPRRPADLGPVAARRLSRHVAQGPVAALPHPDRRGLAHRPAAGQQHRPHRRRGPRGRPRRDQLAAHQRPGRGARAAGRGGRGDRAAHPAGHHGGDRRGERGRPARRLVVRRGAHRPAGGRGGGDFRPYPRDEPGRLDDRRDPARHRERAGSPARSPRPRSPTSSSWRRARRRSSA